MKKLILAFFLLIGIYSNAQLFAPAGAEWHSRYVNYWYPDVTYNQIFKYDGDTVINGINAKRIRYYEHDDTPANATYYSYYFYSDSTSIYCYSRAYGYFTKLVDFSLEVGDSMLVSNIYWPCDEYYNKVIAKGIDTIENIPLRWVEFDEVYTPHPYDILYGKYYEKIGKLDGFIVPPDGCSFDINYFDCLRYYKDDSITIDRTGYCPFTVGIDESLDLNFKVYPNPTTNGTLTIQSKTAVKSIELIDILGQNVLSATPAGNTVNIGSIAQGLYVAKVVFAEGKTGYKRVVVN
jgi:hypothetical protein